MALKLYNESDIQDIADAIRGKNGSSDTYKVSQMADAIDDIPTGGGGGNEDALVNRSFTGSYENSRITNVGRYGLAYLTNVTSINLPNVTTLDLYAFENSGETNIAMPKLETLTNYALKGNTGLTALVLPSLLTAKVQSVYSCSNLERADFPKAITLENQVFWKCGKLNMLVLRSNTCCSLAGAGAFAETPFDQNKSGGTLYVPESLISTYESASNWSTVLARTNNQIKSIESTHTDPDAPIDLTLYYADGTPISS